jgi:drug/metabolite transporter, DME family
MRRGSPVAARPLVVTPAGCRGRRAFSHPVGFCCAGAAGSGVSALCGCRKGESEYGSVGLSEDRRGGGNERARRELFGLALVVVAAVLWGLLGPVARVALREGVESLELGFWRAAIAGVLYALLAVARREWRIGIADAGRIGAFGVAAVAVFYVSYFRAVDFGGAALAAVLLYTAPAWVAIASYLWLGERLTRRAVVAVGLTVLGVAGVALGGGGAARLNLPGVGWGLVAGLTYALYYVVGKPLFGRYGVVPVLAYALPVGALALLPLASFAVKSPAAWAAILFIAVVPTFIAYLVYGAGVLRAPATRAATVAAIEPVVAAVVAFALWGERFTTIGYLGAGLVLGAVVLAASGAGRRAADADGEPATAR